MRRERFERLQAQLEAQGIDGLVLLGSSSVAYATGAAAPAQDGDRAALFRPVAVVVKGDSAPHFVRPEAAMIGLGMIVFCSFLIEGAMADWSAVLLRDTFDTSEAAAAPSAAASVRPLPDAWLRPFALRGMSRCPW